MRLVEDEVGGVEEEEGVEWAEWARTRLGDGRRRKREREGGGRGEDEDSEEGEREPERRAGMMALLARENSDGTISNFTLLFRGQRSGDWTRERRVRL